MNRPFRAPLLAAALLFARLAHAGDAIVTLQYQNPKATAAAGTSVLEPRTLQAVFGAFPNVKGHIVNEFNGQIGKLSVDELKKNYADSKAALGQLGTAALLVLNCHSSSVEVGVPMETGETGLIPWENLWVHFGIVRPPRLALVVLNGCLGVHGPNGEVGSPTDDDLDRVRCVMHTEALISGKRNIATADSQAEIVNFFSKLKGEEGNAGVGWEIRLDGPKGPLTPLRILAMRKGRFVEDESLTISGLKRSAVEFGRPSEVVTAGATDTVKPREDDAHTAEIEIGDSARKWDPSDLTTDAAKIPFRFEFKPRGKIVSAVLEIRVRVVIGDGKKDRWTFIAPGVHAPLREDFSEFVGKDGDAKLKLPAEKALLEQLMTGRLRCVVGTGLRVLSAQLVVTYGE